MGTIVKYINNTGSHYTFSKIIPSSAIYFFWNIAVQNILPECKLIWKIINFSKWQSGSLSMKSHNKLI